MSTIRKFFNFSGRINRRTYLVHSLLLTLLIIVVWVAAATLALQSDGIIFPIIWLALTLAVIVRNLSLLIRRFHDFNGSGLMVFAYIIGSGFLSGVATRIAPFLDTVVTLVMLCIPLLIPGTQGDNKYGPQPEKRIGM